MATIRKTRPIINRAIKSAQSNGWQIVNGYINSFDYQRCCPLWALAKMNGLLKLRTSRRQDQHD